MHLIFNQLTVYSFGNRLLFNLDYVSMGLNSFFSTALCTNWLGEKKLVI